MTKIYYVILLMLFPMVLFSQTETPSPAKKKVKTTKTKTDKKQKGKKKKGKKEEENKIPEHKRKDVTQTIPTLYATPLIKDGKKITGNITTVHGFRVCIYNGNSQQEALKVKQQFASQELQARSYIKYIRPDYRIVVGDYETKKQAQNALKKYTKTFTAAFVVPDIVTIKKIETQSIRTIKQKKTTAPPNEKSKKESSKKNNAIKTTK